MKTVLIVLLTALLAFLTWVVYNLDQWAGIVAFTDRYLLFCLIAALFYCAIWHLSIKKHAIPVGMAAFAILAANLILPAPSERILRSALLRIPPGTPSDIIETIVKEAYEGSGYGLPRIFEEDDRVFVSLMSQEPGNCTALIFKTRDGVVVDSEYSLD